MVASERCDRDMVGGLEIDADISFHNLLFVCGFHYKLLILYFQIKG